jgi:hypothetical protein
MLTFIEAFENVVVLHRAFFGSISAQPTFDMFCEANNGDYFIISRLVAETWMVKDMKKNRDFTGAKIEEGCIEIPVGVDRSFLLHVDSEDVDIRGRSWDDMPESVRTSMAANKLSPPVGTGTIENLKPDLDVAIRTNKANIEEMKEAEVRWATEAAQPINKVAIRMAEEPGLVEKAKNFTSSMVEWATSGFPVVDNDLLLKRKEVCNTCEFWDKDGYMGAGKCKKCGCSGIKLNLATSVCPAGKW